MIQQDRMHEKSDLDGLRLFALGRIPRCAGCARYRSLVAAQGRVSRTLVSLSAVPASCSHQVCAPLVDHYFGRRSESWGPRAAACGL